MAKRVRIRTLSNWSILLTILLAVICVALTLVGLRKYRVLRSAMRDYILCESAAQKLQEGSDRLTKQVRLAAAIGEQRYIDAYFEEANVTRTREHALAELDALDNDPDAITALREALALSDELMQTEYYALRLVEEAIHADPAVWPEALQDCSLSADDAAASDTEKLSRARQIVIGERYECAKDEISDDVNASLAALTNEINARQETAAVVFSRILRIVAVCVLFLACMTLVSGLVTRFWIVRPLTGYTDQLRGGPLSPVDGVYELQMLADTYNRVYAENSEREKLMKHQAEHDPLTGVLNRRSFDSILGLYEKDENDFALILLDVDFFKQINDIHGHAAGDQLLKRVASLLLSTFRSIDYVFRIGGDEFAVIMVKMNSDLNYTITEKLDSINARLAAPEDGLPAVSLSAGAAVSDRKQPGVDLFKAADLALYYTKEHGKSGCCFYPLPAEDAPAANT